MARKQPVENLEPLPPPATTLEGREDQLINAAMNLVERRIQEGTASAQETVHFLRLGSVRNQLEQDKLRNEVEVLRTRVQEMESRKNSGELYEKALRAMRGYQGLDDAPEEDDYDSYL
jgi:hypothetical protein